MKIKSPPARKTAEDKKKAAMLSSSSVCVNGRIIDINIEHGIVTFISKVDNPDVSPSLRTRAFLHTNPAAMHITSDSRLPRNSANEVSMRASIRLRWAVDK